MEGGGTAAAAADAVARFDGRRRPAAAVDRPDEWSAATAGGHDAAHGAAAATKGQDAAAQEGSSAGQEGSSKSLIDWEYK